jgi:hypothetical protein
MAFLPYETMPRDAEVPAYLLSQEVIDFRVPWDGGGFSGGGVPIQGMLFSLT